MQVECQQEAEHEGQLTLTLQQQTVSSDSEVSHEAAPLGHVEVRTQHVDLNLMLIQAFISGLLSGDSINGKLFEQEGP